MATVLRLLLDDAHMPVVTAAAEAMAVLVGPGPEEEDTWQAADCNPVTGRKQHNSHPSKHYSNITLHTTCLRRFANVPLYTTCLRCLQS